MLNRLLTLGLLVSTALGCSSNNNSGSSIPTEAGSAIAQTLGMIQESTYGGTPLKDLKAAESYANQFPDAVSAIKSGEIVIVWGRSLLDNAKEPQIVAYESSASSGEGWAVKEDGKLHKIGASDIKGLPKAQSKTK